MDLPQEAVFSNSAKPLEGIVEALENADFPVAFRGYEPRDVRTFLMGIADDVRRWTAHQHTMFIELSARVTELEAGLKDAAAVNRVVQQKTVEVAAAVQILAVEVDTGGAT